MTEKSKPTHVQINMPIIDPETGQKFEIPTFHELTCPRATASVDACVPAEAVRFSDAR